MPALPPHLGVILGLLDGRVAIVTGASRGIGQHIAERFAAEGAAVAIVARTVSPGTSNLPGSLEEVADRIRAHGGKAEAVPADLTDPANGQRAFRRIYQAPKAYRGPYTDHAPDLIVGYESGYRVSWDAAIGRTARRKLWPSWLRIHMIEMGTSYILMITAFYVDNGPNLPLWRELPPLAFWILPTLIGAPILINALLHHPLARNHRS